MFLLSVAAGYLIPYRDPDSRGGRAYLWVMGPLLKGAGACAFLIDHYVRQSPASFLLFAASDGALALLTVWVLLRGSCRVMGYVPCAPTASSLAREQIDRGVHRRMASISWRD